MKFSFLSLATSMVVASIAANVQAQIIISQVVDGNLTGGTPKVYELTNVGSSAVSLSNLQLQFGSNGGALSNGLTLTTVLSPLTQLTAGQTVTITPTGSDDEFLAITSFSPTGIGGTSVNGNDVVALVDTTGPTTLDVFGTIGDSANFYVDSSAVRNSNITTGSSTYNSADWTITGPILNTVAGHQAAIGTGASGNNRLGFHTAAAAGVPEADVFLGATPVADEATGVNLGSFTQGTGTQTITFTVTNSGSAALTTSGLSVTGTGFSAGADGLIASITASSSDTFTVSIDTTNSATLTGNISFANNDSDENPYNFGITATVALVPTNTPAFTAYTTSSTTVRATFTTAPLNGGETTPANYLLNSVAPTSVATVSSGVYDLTFATLTGDLTVDSLVFNNGVDVSANDAFFAGIVPLSTIRAAILADATPYEPVITAAGNTITVAGIVVENTLDVDEFRLQQGTSGLAFFDGANGATTDFPISIAVGDSVIFAGEIGYFNGLAQVVAPVYGNLVAASQPLPAYQTINTLTAVAADYEAAESTLVTYTNVTFVAGGQRDPGAAWATGSANVNINSFPLSLVRRDSDINVTGNVPTTTGSVSGVLVQFDGSVPRNESYQVVPTLGDADFNFSSNVNDWMFQSY